MDYWSQVRLESSKTSEFRRACANRIVDRRRGRERETSRGRSFFAEVEVAARGEIMHVKRGFNGDNWNPPETCSSAFACTAEEDQEATRDHCERVGE